MEFSEYLKIIEIEEPIKKRVEKIIAFYNEVLTESVKDIFVTDEITKEGKRIYKNRNCSRG